MSEEHIAPASRRGFRTPTDRVGPIRNAGGYYRTAESKDRSHGGIPLNTVSDSVVAVVQMAYKVADAQVDRSLRLARRLREAGDRAVGPRSDRQALDAAERLVMKALMSGLAWWEASVAEGRCPVKRLAAAEYQMLGSMLGLTPTPHARTAGKPGGEEAAERARSRGGTDTGARKAASSRPGLQVVHKGEKKYRRPVLIENWEIAGAGPLETLVFLHGVDDPNSEPLEAELTISAKSDARLILEVEKTTAPGRRRGVICDDSGVQVGFIEIVL